MPILSTRILTKKRLLQLLIVALFAWTLFVLAWYYRQIIFLIIKGPAFTEDYSISASITTIKGLINGGGSAWQLPAFGEAVKRAAHAVLGAATVILALELLGYWLFKLARWQLQNWQERVIFQTVGGLLLLYMIFLALAVSGFYQPLVIKIIMLAVILISGMAVLVNWKNRKESLDRLWKDIRRGIKRDRIWLTIVAIAIVMGFVGALAPEIEYDALWYHLWIPKLWLQQGYMVDLIAEYISLYPFTWELILGAGLVLGGVVGAKLLGFFVFIMSGVLVFQFSRRFFDTTSAWLAVALFVTIPIVLWESTTSYIDLVVAFFIGCTFYAVFSYLEERHFKWLGLATITMGMALATKHLAIVIWLIVVFGMSIYLWKESCNIRTTIVPVLVLAGVSLLIPSPWYLRSWSASGNPFFPELYAIFGAQPPTRWSELTQIGLDGFKQSFGDARTPLNLILLPWNATIHAARYGGTLGPLFLILLPAILAFQRNRYIRWLSISVLFYILFWASPLSSYQMRFLVPITPLLALLGAQAISHVQNFVQEVGWKSEVPLIIIAGLLVLNLPPFLSLHEGDRVKWDGWMTHILHTLPVGVVIGHVSQDTYLGSKIPAYRAWEFINDNLPPDAYVLTFLGGDNYYSERVRLPYDSTLAHPGVWGAARGEEQGALAYLHNLGITHILFDKHDLASGELDYLAITNPMSITDCYTVQYQDDRTILYKLEVEIDADHSISCKS